MKQGVTPYGDTRGKGEQVERMFDAIAPAYDFMNGAMTLGLHRRWRNRALRAATAGAGPLRDCLDIATGTGDVAFALARCLPHARITGVDLSAGMLKIARGKLEHSGESVKKRITFEQGDSLALPYADGSFDLVTVAYGVRNFEHLDRGLAEMARVLRPGGRLCIIELSEPRMPHVRALYRAYARHIIPAVGRLVSGDSSAYTYLPLSIAAAPQRDDLTARIRRAGFSHTRWHSMTCGAVTYYLAEK